MAASVPFKSIKINILKPLPKTTRYSRYMRVVIDYYIRLIGAFALKHHDAHIFTLRLLLELIFHYGHPYVIYTDQGTNIEFYLIDDLCKLYNNKKTRTTPYHPQTAGP